MIGLCFVFRRQIHLPRQRVECFTFSLNGISNRLLFGVRVKSEFPQLSHLSYLNHRFVRYSRTQFVENFKLSATGTIMSKSKLECRFLARNLPPKINFIPKMLCSHQAEIKAQTEKINCFGLVAGSRKCGRPRGRGLLSVRFSRNCQLIGNSANSMRFGGPSAYCQLIDFAPSLGRRPLGVVWP